jgi:hypothetical protein
MPTIVVDHFLLCVLAFWAGDIYMTGMLPLTLNLLKAPYLRC